MPYVTNCPHGDHRAGPYEENDLPRFGEAKRVTCPKCSQPFTWVENQDAAEKGFDGKIAIGWEHIEDVWDRLRKKGATPIDLYNQGDLIDKFSPDDKESQEGICAGQCLHWVRRVLTGGQVKYSKSRSPDGEKKHRRGVAAQKVLAGEKYTWDREARKFDEQHGLKHGFALISLVHRVDRNDFESTEKFVEALFNDTNFAADRGAVISIGLRKGTGSAGGAISGHAVAVHRPNGGQLCIFDPNFGMFTCNSVAQAKASLCELTQCWEELHGWELDHQYGHSIFSLKSDSFPLRKTNVVDYAPSVAATALLNKQVIAASTKSAAPADLGDRMQRLRAARINRKKNSAGAVAAVCSTDFLTTRLRNSTRNVGVACGIIGAWTSALASISVARSSMLFVEVLKWPRCSTYRSQLRRLVNFPIG